MALALALALSISIGVVEAAPPVEQAKVSDEGYARARAAVERVTDELDCDDQGQVALLDAASEQLRHHYRALAEDEGGQDLLGKARGLLVECLLHHGEQQRAEQVMDRALLESPTRSLPVDDFRPSARLLHDQRKLWLADQGRARVRLRCAEPCVAYVGYTRVEDELSPELLLGTHEFHVELRSSPSSHYTTRVELSKPGAIEPLPALVTAGEPPPEPGLHTEAVEDEPRPDPSTAGEPEPPPQSPTLDLDGLELEPVPEPPSPPPGPEHPGLSKAGLAVLSLGLIAAVVAGGALATRATTDYMLDRSSEDVARADDVHVIRAYDTSGVVAFGTLIGAAALVPVGAIMVVVGKGPRRAELRAGVGGLRLRF